MYANKLMYAGSFATHFQELFLHIRLNCFEIICIYIYLYISILENNIISPKKFRDILLLTYPSVHGKAHVPQLRKSKTGNDSANDTAKCCWAAQSRPSFITITAHVVPWRHDCI